MSWTQSICRSCFGERNPGRRPVRIIDPDTETCCDCGQSTDGGIYIRADPATVAHPRIEVD